MSIPPRDPLRPLLFCLATAVDVPKFQMQAKSKPNCHTLPTGNARCPTGRSTQALQAKRKQVRVSIPPSDRLLPLCVGLGTAVGLPNFHMRATSKPKCHTLATGKAGCPTGRSKQALQARRKQARVSIPPRDLLWPLRIGLPTVVELVKRQIAPKFAPTSPTFPTFLDPWPSFQASTRF